MSKDLKFSKQCLLAKNKVNLILGIINRGVWYESAEVTSKLYRSYVRPYLENCIQIVCRYAGRGQRTATKIISSLRNLYDERLKMLGMFFLRRRRLRGDMIEGLKRIYGIDKVNLGKVFVWMRMEEQRD